MGQGARHIKAIILKFSKTPSVLHVQASCHVSLLTVVQVRMMDTIYSIANTVIVWLSSSSNDFDIMEVGPRFG